MTRPEDPVLRAGRLDDEPHPHVVAVLEECYALTLERQGIAMFVALHDLRPSRSPTTADPATRQDGERAAELLDHYDAHLAAAAYPLLDPEPVPTGARELLDALVALGDRHLRAREVARE